MTKTLEASPKQIRADLKYESETILNRAESEARQLTSDESRRVEDIIGLLNAQNDADLLKRASESRGVFAGRPDTATLEQHDGGIATLARDDSFARHLAQTGHGLPPELRGMSFGGLARAMVTGARTEPERRALSEGTNAAGGFTVPDFLSAQLIDLMRKKTTVLSAGATTVPLTTDITNMARLASDPVASWRIENALVGTGDPTFERVQFIPQSLAVLVKVSRELLDDSVNVNDALDNAFAKSMALELDRVALMGSGTAPEPRGITNTAGVGTVSMGTNGASLSSYDNILDAVLTLLSANANDPTAAIMAPRTRVTLGKLKDGQARPLIRPDMIAALPFLTTTQVGITDTQGTATTASKIIMGYFPHLMIGIRSAMRVELLKERFADNLQYGFLVHMRADIQLAHPQSFVEVVGII